MNAINQKKLRLFLVLAASCAIFLLMSISDTPRSLDYTISIKSDYNKLEHTHHLLPTTVAAHCQAYGITPIALPNPSNPKYIVFYPYGGMGNVLLSYVSSVMYACLTGRILKIAPSDERDHTIFDCPEFFDEHAPHSLCRGLEMDDALSRRYKASDTMVKHPEAWDYNRHCPQNRPSLEYFLCDDGLSNDEFVAVNSCHYWGDLFYDNPYFKTEISTQSFRKILRDIIDPSDRVKQKMVPDEGNAPYRVCVHVRWEVSHTAINLGSDWVNNLNTCVRNILARYDNQDQNEILLFTMHKDVRDAIKGSLEGRSHHNDHPIRVRFASETKSESSHSDDKHAGVADMFSMGKQCMHLLPSHQTSTYFVMAANLMDDVSVFPGDQWKEGCLEGSEMKGMIPRSAYWQDLGQEKDVCNLKDSTCRVKDGSIIRPSLRFYENNSWPILRRNTIAAVQKILGMQFFFLLKEIQIDIPMIHSHVLTCPFSACMCANDPPLPEQKKETPTDSFIIFIWLGIVG